MTPVLVTGATGFLGEHLCRVLVEHGHTVRGLARSRSGVLADLGVEHVRGDVLDGRRARSRRSTACRAVFHLAGAVSRDPDDAPADDAAPRRRHAPRARADGTPRASRRMVLASTSGTIGVSKDEEILDETRAATPRRSSPAGRTTPRRSTRSGSRSSTAQRLGIEVVAVNPSLLLGPGDRRLSSTGDVRKFLKRQIPTIPDGGINFVDARDAAARDRERARRTGRAGERYLLGGPNWTMKEFFAPARPRRQRRAAAAQAAAEARTAGARRSSRSSIASAARSRRSIGSRSRWPSTTGGSTRARPSAELGFAPRDPQLTLVDTVAYLRQGVDA